MSNYESNQFSNELYEYQTPFADEDSPQNEKNDFEQSGPKEFSNSFIAEFESPFLSTYEHTIQSNESKPYAPEYVSLIAELEDSEFEGNLFGIASELEDVIGNKISGEYEMGSSSNSYINRQANDYFAPLALELESVIDKINEHYSNSTFNDLNELEVENYFSSFISPGANLSPAQEQFFGSVINKVKNVVKKGIDIAKQGIKAVGKLIPIGPILDKLKALIKPLLNRVLKFAIGKLPKEIQPYAHNLAKKFLNLETPGMSGYTLQDTNETPSSGDLKGVSSEFDHLIANLVFSESEEEAVAIVNNYTNDQENIALEQEAQSYGIANENIESARVQFINDLKNLKDGESSAPAIERFLPVAMMALKPVLRMALNMIGRKKIINFLAGFLAKLIDKYVPQNVAQPLAASIIDAGMNILGFETYERANTDLAYEALVNTVEEVVNNMNKLDEATLNNNEALAQNVYELFENAVPNFFPQSRIKPNLRKSNANGTWVLMPRFARKFSYRKFTRTFIIKIDPIKAKRIKTFNGIPLSNFLADVLGIDTERDIEAKVHLYEAIPGTWLSKISKFEKVTGLNTPAMRGWCQIHPLSVETASLLLNEPGLGKDFGREFTSNRNKIAVGQRFYYLEINGASVKNIYPPAPYNPPQPQYPVTIPPNVSTPPQGAYPSQNLPFNPKPNLPQPQVPRSSDIQAVLNFLKSEIRINYFFSEKEAIELVKKVRQNDAIGAAQVIRNSVRDVLNNILIKDIGNKVKIIHEAVPELYLNNYTPENENSENFLPAIGKAVLTKLIEELTKKIVDAAYDAVVKFLKARAIEFINAQNDPNDGVTIKIIWNNISGMNTIKAIINAVKNKLSIGDLTNLVIPKFPLPDILIKPGKLFD